MTIKTIARRFVQRLAEAGRYHFSTEETVGALDVSKPAALAALRRLKVKGEVAVPYRGFYVIVPPEYRRIGCLPAEQFVPNLMVHLGLDYYVGLLSAARYYGAAHQQPQELQVVVAKNRPSIRCGQVRVAFIARREMQRGPTQSRNTPRGIVLISTPELTSIDLVGYPRHAGGWGNVATVLSELAEAIDPAQLDQVARQAPTAWVQRLGYLLELVEQPRLANRLTPLVEQRDPDMVSLTPWLKKRGASRQRKWRLLVNDSVETDL